MDYVCKIATPSGRVLSQTEQAASEPELRKRLTAEGYYIFSIRPKDILGARLAFFKQKKIRPDDFLIFNQQFLTLSKSGLPLQRALDLLAKQARSEALREALETVRDNVKSGNLLSEAFEATGRFPKIYAATLRAGERSGSLDKVLGQYVTYQKLSRSFRKRFISAMIYPAFLVVFLGILISFVVGFIVPRFALLYNDLGWTLPTITEETIAFSMGIRHYAVEILAGIAGLIVLWRVAWRSARVRLAWDRFKFGFPIVGPLLLKFSAAEFARTMATLIQGGLPVVAALETTRNSVTSPLLVEAVTGAQREVLGGRSLHASLRACGFFPPTALDMIEVGESTGALPQMLDSLAEYYEEDVNIDLSALVALVDPLMIAAIAVVVAFILIAFYLPLFSMGSQIG
ncbi:MAG TPA: type II secretion system F family protein [Terriglobia bacterium]|nr:type II secretion system F family protein [Terriglobia bacterium]